MFQETHAQVAAVNDTAAVIAFLACEDGEQGRLAHAVLGDKADLLAFADGEGDILKQEECTERFRQVLHVKIGIHEWWVMD